MWVMWFSNKFLIKIITRRWLLMSYCKYVLRITLTSQIRTSQLPTSCCCFSSNGKAIALFARAKRSPQSWDWLQAAQRRSSFSRTSRTKSSAHSTRAEVNCVGHDVYRCGHREERFAGAAAAMRSGSFLIRLTSVAYSARTATLLICTRDETSQTIRAFARTNATEWFGCRSLEMPELGGYGDIALRPLRDGRLVAGCRDSTTRELQVLEVDLSGRLDGRAPVVLTNVTLPQRYFAFDATTAGGELLLAATCEPPRDEPERGGSVVLYRIEIGHGAQELSRCARRCMCWWPLFFRDALLVFTHPEATEDWEVLEFGTGGGRLEPRRVVLSGRFCHPFKEQLVPEWCISNDTLLVAWDPDAQTLSSYSMP